jgi:hypothetical protein
VQFQSSEAGTVTAIRVYLALPIQTGSKVDLWSPSGTLLGSEMIPPGSGSAPGWVTVALAQAVAIQAGVTYTASYYSSGGSWVYTPNYFGNSVRSGPLTALKGVGQYGKGGAFPSNPSDQNYNYWVDIVFVPR